MVLAFQHVMARVDASAHHHITREVLSIRERMTLILSQVTRGGLHSFTDFLSFEEGRAGLVVSFIAILELIRESLVDIVQSVAFSPIYLKAKA